MNPSIFREYDIRGVAERDLTDEVVQNIGRAFASAVIEKKKASPSPSSPARVCVASDCRLSGPRLHQALTKGLMDQGIHVLDMGIGPTPYLYFSVHKNNADGGVMITGSHNPSDENGFKMMMGTASFYGRDIQHLKDRILSSSFSSLSDFSKEKKYETCDLRSEYLFELTRDIQVFSPSFSVVLDAGNGAGGPLGLLALQKLGVKTEGLFCDMDGRFPHHHPDPTDLKNLDVLIKRVKETKARVGLAFDGDADRLGVVDQDGKVIWGDKLLILFARDLLKKRPHTEVIGEVKCSQTLYDDIEKHGGKAIMWKTGHSLIKTKMRESGALLAGEMSGHLFFADRYYGYDDALYAALRVVELLAADERSLGEMLSDVPATFATPEIRVECPDDLKFKVVHWVMQHYKDRGFEVVDIDGARVSFRTEEGPAWGLLRASNTGPILVMRFEAASESYMNLIHHEMVELVSKAKRTL